MDSKKEKKMLILAIVGEILFMIGDWCIDAFGPGNVEIGIAGNTAWEHMSMWRFTASNILGAIGLPMSLPGVLVWMRIADKATIPDNKTSVQMNKIFKCGLWAYLISGIFIHVFCGLLGVVYKASVNAGVSSEIAFQITDASLYSVIVPFFVYYLVLELGVGIPFWYMVLTKKLNLPKATVLCCSLSTLIIVGIVNSISGNYVLHDIITAGESFGWLLLMAAGISQLNREEKQKKVAG